MMKTVFTGSPSGPSPTLAAAAAAAAAVRVRAIAGLLSATSRDTRRCCAMTSSCDTRILHAESGQSKPADASE